MRRHGRSTIQRIFSTAFAKLPASEDRRLCQPSVDANAIVARIRAEVTPTADQEEPLQRLGGALGAAVRLPGQSLPDGDSGTARCRACS